MAMATGEVMPALNGIVSARPLEQHARLPTDRTRRLVRLAST